MIAGASEFYTLNLAVGTFSDNREKTGWCDTGLRLASMSQ
jgi:hypothetical protein